MQILYYTLLIIGGFIWGSIMFCELIPKKLLNKDVYEISVDHNPGAFNVFKHCGKKIGMPCLFLDVLKGFIPVLLASLFLNADSIAFSFVVVAPALGHALGLFNRLRGGKCIATSFGIAFGLIPVTWIPIVALAALYILFSTAIKIKNAAIRSVVVYLLFALIACPIVGVLDMAYAAIGVALLASIPIVKFLGSKNGLVKNGYRDERVADDVVFETAM